MLKPIITVFLGVITAFSSFCQSNILAGDRCFESCDYACAVTNYNNAFRNATGKDKQIAEIKLSRAKWCAEHIKTANQAFVAKIFSTAKAEYQKVLDSNPNDFYAKSQIIKCDNILNPPQLRKASTTEINDIWNNKYGNMPERRNNLIAAGIDPDDAQRRINKGEGKVEISLNVSKENISLSSKKSKISINVNTNSPAYQISKLPIWCRVENKYVDSFILICDENQSSNSRSGTFVISAGHKKIDVYISQAKGKSKRKSNKSNSSFFAFGYEGGQIANYGFRMEFGGRRFVGMFLNVRSSFISNDEILNHYGLLENKNEAVIGLNFKIYRSVFLNLGGGYGFFKQLTNEKLEGIEYFPAYGGLTLRVGRRINLSGGISFSDIEDSYTTNIFDPEYTLGLTINLKK